MREGEKMSEKARKRKQEVIDSKCANKKVGMGMLGTNGFTFWKF